MKVISLHQPWAQWIAMGLMTIEARKHKGFFGLVGKCIAIHAAKKVDLDAMDKAYRYLDDQRQITYRESGGMILCTVFVQEARVLTSKDSPQALRDVKGLFGLILRDVQVLENPIHWKGSSSIFNAPDKILKSYTKGPGQEPGSDENGTSKLCHSLWRLHRKDNSILAGRAFMQASELFPIEMANVILRDASKQQELIDKNNLKNYSPHRQIN